VGVRSGTSLAAGTSPLQVCSPLALRDRKRGIGGPKRKANAAATAVAASTGHLARTSAVAAASRAPIIIGDTVAAAGSGARLSDASVETHDSVAENVNSEPSTRCPVTASRIAAGSGWSPAYDERYA